MIKNTITYGGWLTIKATKLDRPYGTIAIGRLTKKKPTVDFNEVAIKLEVALPRSLFVQPALTAQINVNEDDTTPPVISLEVQDTVAEVLRDRTGFNVRIVEGDKDE